jgi:hypothetical protein
MSIGKQSTISEAGKLADTNRQAAVKESSRKITSAKLIRWTGLAAMAAGIIFAAIQPIHPPDEVASVTTSTWAIITTLKFVMCFFFLLGIVGLYARQSEESGWLGLAGYIVFSLGWAVQSGFVFLESFAFPPLAGVAPQFVDSLLMATAKGQPPTMNLGALPAIYNLLVGIPYMLGGGLFGIAMFRARVVPRLPAALLAVVALLTPAAALLPHAIQRVAAGMPMGIVFAWLGYVLWSERQDKASA